jgi:hypothetical protein
LWGRFAILQFRKLTICCGVGPDQVFEISEKSIKICLEKWVRRAFLALKRAI